MTDNEAGFLVGSTIIPEPDPRINNMISISKLFLQKLKLWCVVMYSKCIIVYQRYPCSLHKVGYSLRYRTPFIKRCLFLLERKICRNGLYIIFTNFSKFLVSSVAGLSMRKIVRFFNPSMYLEESPYFLKSHN